MRYNFISLHDRIRRRSDALHFAQEKDIIKSTSKCKTCATLKPNFYKPLNPPLIKATQPLERISIDFANKGHTTSREDKH